MRKSYKTREKKQEKKHYRPILRLFESLFLLLSDNWLSYLSQGQVTETNQKLQNDGKEVCILLA